MKLNCVRTAAWLLSCVLLLSCGAESDANKTVAGNWIILYPDHQLTSTHQREVYGRHQDSLVKLYGLKLIALKPDGRFYEMDSLHRPAGQWLFTPDSLLKIREAGKGFNPFNAAYTSLQNDELLLTQYLPLEDEKVKLVWHLKKISDDSAAARLFLEEGNAWRKKPTTPEATAALQKRLAAMLDYYAQYFAFVGKEASYFAPVRIPLPFHYYQHDVGLKTGMSDGFIKAFYNQQQAMEAYHFLEKGMEALQGRFPHAENFVVEYGLFLKKLSDWISQHPQP